MSAARRGVSRLWPALSALCLVVALALITTAPGPVAGTAPSGGAAESAAAAGTAHPCDPARGSTATTCDPVHHACAACLIGLFAPPVSGQRAGPPRPAHRAGARQATGPLAGPEVPHGPPRFA